MLACGGKRDFSTFSKQLYGRRTPVAFDQRIYSCYSDFHNHSLTSLYFEWSSFLLSSSLNGKVFSVPPLAIWIKYLLANNPIAKNHSLKLSLTYGMNWIPGIYNTNLALSASAGPLDSWKCLTSFPCFQDSPKDRSYVLRNVVMFVSVLVLQPSPVSLVLNITCISEVATCTAANLLHEGIHAGVKGIISQCFQSCSPRVRVGMSSIAGARPRLCHTLPPGSWHCLGSLHHKVSDEIISCGWK